LPLTRCTAFVLSLGPSVLAHLTGVTNPLVAGAMACAMFMAAPLAQLPARRAPVLLLVSGLVATVALVRAGLQHFWSLDDRLERRAAAQGDLRMSQCRRAWVPSLR
jgi:hypothetical protein